MSGIQFVALFIVAYSHLWVSAAGRCVGRCARRILRRRSHADPDRDGDFRRGRPQSPLVRGRAENHAGGCGTGRLGRGGDCLQRGVGGLFLLLIAVGAALAYSIAGSGNLPFISGLNDLAWAFVVLTSFPRAMLVMSRAFGLWRAGLISNPLFAAGVAAVVLVCWAAPRG